MRRSYDADTVGGGLADLEVAEGRHAHVVEGGQQRQAAVVGTAGPQMVPDVLDERMSLVGLDADLIGQDAAQGHHQEFVRHHVLPQASIDGGWRDHKNRRTFSS